MEDGGGFKSAQPEAMDQRQGGGTKAMTKVKNPVQQQRDNFNNTVLSKTKTVKLYLKCSRFNLMLMFYLVFIF